MASYDFSRYLNIRIAYAPSFTPHGDAIAFLTDITGVPQVWQVSSNGGWPEQLTFFADRVSLVEYARASERAVIGMDADRRLDYGAWWLGEVRCLGARRSAAPAAPDGRQPPGSRP